MARQWPAVHPGGGEGEMPQHRRRNVDERGAAVVHTGDETAAGGQQERSLLVAAEPAMLAETTAVLGFERITNDVAVAGHPVRIGAAVGLQCQSDLRRRIRRQPDLGEFATEERSADPVLSL